jgi:ribose transport system permease protein
MNVASLLSPRRISGIYLLIVLVIFFSIATDTFFTTTTLRTIATEQAITAVVAMGLTIALAAGVFDLSIAGTMGLANIVVAKLMADAGLDPVFAVLLTLLVGALVGVINGLLVVYARIDPFIATLGTNSILLAAIFVVSGNKNVLGVPVGFQSVAGDQIAGIPLPVFYVIGLGLILWYVLAWTPVGRRLYATGGGREVARLAGVPTNRYIISAFVCSAAIAAAAGVLVVATIGTGSTEVGASYLLPAFAAGFLGATQFRPGRFNIWGTLLAVYLLATGVKGLVLMGADVWVPDLFNGLALIVAVGLSGIQRRAKTRERREPAPAADSGGGGLRQPTTTTT